MLWRWFAQDDCGFGGVVVEVLTVYWVCMEDVYTAYCMLGSTGVLFVRLGIVPDLALFVDCVECLKLSQSPISAHSASTNFRCVTV